MARGISKGLNKKYKAPKPHGTIYSVYATKNGRREQYATTYSNATAKRKAKEAKDNGYTDVRIVVSG
jgi:hypothetical protein